MALLEREALHLLDIGSSWRESPNCHGADAPLRPGAPNPKYMLCAGTGELGVPAWGLAYASMATWTRG